MFLHFSSVVHLSAAIFVCGEAHETILGLTIQNFVESRRRPFEQSLLLFSQLHLLKH